ILQLYHQDITAVADLQWRQLLTNFVDVLAVFGYILAFGTAYNQSFFILQPVRVAAKFPFGTYIGAGAQYYPQSLLLCCFYKGGNIIITGKVKMVFLWFVQIPKHIRTNGIQPHGLGHLHTGTPGLAGYTRVMDLTGYHMERFIIQHK